MNKLILRGTCSFLSLVALSASAQDYYWDNNQLNPAGSGTWDLTSTNWATNSTGTLTNFTDAYPATGAIAIFAAGPTNMGTFAISVATPNIPILALEDNGFSAGRVTNLTFNASGGGSLSLVAGTDQMYQNAGVTVTINCPIVGPGGIIQNGSGVLALYGNNTYTGGTTLTGGQNIYYNNGASFGTGTINITGTSALALLTTNASAVTLTNAWVVNDAGVSINFGDGNTICTGPWTLQSLLQIRNNSATAPMTLSGAISGAFGVDLYNDNTYAVGPAAATTLSGANTYTGPTSIGLNGAGGTSCVYVTSINSVTTPAQQASSSLGKPSSVANGTIALGQSGDYTNALIYTGPGETSDRVINLSGTTGPAYIEMDGTGPLVLTSAFTATGAGIKTLVLQGSSTATNTIGGAIVNNSSTDKTSLTKAQAGTWELSGVSTFTGNTTISLGTLIIGGAGDFGSGSYAGTIANSGTFIYSSTASQTFSGVISGAGTLTQSNGTLLLDAANTYTGTTTLAGGTAELDHAEIAGTSGPLGKFAATAAGSIVLEGGTLEYLSVNAANDYSGRFSTAANQQYNIDVNGQTVQFGTALSSSGGALSLKSTTAGGTLTLNAAYSGSIGITGGTLNIGSAGSLAGGAYSGNITDNGTFEYSGSGAQTMSGVVSGTGGITESGPGGLTLTGANTYTGATTVSPSSTIYLSGAGSLNGGALNIAASGTFDVSQLSSPYTLNSSSLSAAESTGGASASINGASGGVVNFGSQPISITISNAGAPALGVLQASLTLNGNAFTVNNASGAPLNSGGGPGSSQNFPLINTPGAITGNPSPYVVVTGSGLASGDFATISVSGNQVVLTVSSPANVNPTWNGNDYGTHQTWSDAANWVSGVPDATGDQVFFDNTSGSETPVMDSSYSVYSLNFMSGCSSDVLTASGGSTLTVGSGLTNSSGNLQTLSLPVMMADLGDPSVPSSWDLTGGSITDTGVVSDTGNGLVVTGSGNTLTLSGANTFTGPVTLNSGVNLTINSIADSGTSALGLGSLVTLNGGSTIDYTGGTSATARTFSLAASTTTILDVPSGVTLSLNGPMTGHSPGGFLTKTDSGTLIIGGTNNDSYFGMNVNGGTVILNKTVSGNALGSATTINSGGTLQLSGSGYGSEIYSGSTTPITIATGGVFDSGGQNNTLYSLSMAGTGSGSGALINSTGNSTLTTPITLTANATVGGSGNLTLPSAISGSGLILTYAGTGTLTLGSTTSTFSGGTMVDAGGTLRLTGGGTTAVSAGPGSITLNGNGALTLAMTNTEMNNVVTGGTTSSINIYMGAGNLWLSNSAAGQFSAFTGTFNVNTTSTSGGQLVIGTSSYFQSISSSAVWQIQSGAVVDFNGGQNNPGTVYLYGFPVTNAGDGALRLDASVQSGNVILMGTSEIGNGNAGVSTISGVISDANPGYGFVKMGPDPILLTALNTYRGPTVISNGNITISSSGDLGDNGSGSGAYSGNISNYGSFTYSSSAAQTLSGVISGTGTLTQDGGGTLTLSGADTYTGATAVGLSATLALAATGSIDNSSSLNLVAGASFDVSAYATYNGSAATTINASGAGTTPGGNAATINGAAGGIVNLGSAPIMLTYTPTSFTGDPIDPALYISQGQLQLNGNTFTVSNATAQPLGVGSYVIVQQASASPITHAGTFPVTVTGSGLVAGNSASIVVSGNTVSLVVAPPLPPTAVITSATLLGTTLTLSGTNGFDNGAYYILWSTNLATPLSNWVNIGSGTFGSAGGFTNSLTVTNSPGFYLIGTPTSE